MNLAIAILLVAIFILVCLVMYLWGRVQEVEAQRWEDIRVRGRLEEAHRWLFEFEPVRIAIDWANESDVQVGNLKAKEWRIDVLREFMRVREGRHPLTGDKIIGEHR